MRSFFSLRTWDNRVTLVPYAVFAEPRAFQVRKHEILGLVQVAEVLKRLSLFQLHIGLGIPCTESSCSIQKVENKGIVPKD